MKKLVYLIVVIVALGLIVSGCSIPLKSVVPSPEKSKCTVWHVPVDFATIQGAIDSEDVVDGDKIIVGPGEWFGAVVYKAVEIRGAGAVIVDGPYFRTVKGRDLKQGFKITSGGVTISHFTFEVEFPVFAAYIDDVTVEHNIVSGAIQGVTNWYGSGWVIRHNVMSDIWEWYGGGLAIFIGAKVGYPATDNLVAFNKITSGFPEERDYSCTGICLMTYGGEIMGNKVVHNDVLITGFEAYAIGMTLSKYTPLDIEPQDVLYDNKIGFNDLRGSDVEIACTISNPERDGGYLPDDEARELMEGCNLISRNLGDNRAYDGIPAREFRPVAEE